MRKRKEIERKYWTWKEIERVVKFLYEQTYDRVDVYQKDYIAIVESKLKKQFYKPPHTD